MTDSLLTIGWLVIGYFIGRLHEFTTMKMTSYQLIHDAFNVCDRQHKLIQEQQEMIERLLKT